MCMNRNIFISTITLAKLSLSCFWGAKGAPILFSEIVFCMASCSYTVWPEILAGRYFGGLLKICHLAEFTLAVEPVLAIIIFIAKWLIDRAGNLTGP